MDEISRIDPLEVRRKYDKMERIWAPDDSWHMHVSRRYDKEISGFLNGYSDKSQVLVNIGSGDKVYGTSSFLINIDLSEKFLGRQMNPICAVAGAIPLTSCISDAVICIGSVINYCDAIEALSEISRILKTNGKALLDFESSEGFEYYGTANFGKIATIVDTRFGNSHDRIWLYKPSYIREILLSLGMRTLATTYIHALSSVIYRITGSERFSSGFCAFDSLVATTPLRKFAANIILVCQKL